jgi:hypothetical protein
MTRPEWVPADPEAHEQWIQEQLAKMPTAADIAANPDKARRLARLLGLTTGTPNGGEAE